MKKQRVPLCWVQSATLTIYKDGRHYASDGTQWSSLGRGALTHPRPPTDPGGCSWSSWSLKEEVEENVWSACARRHPPGTPPLPHRARAATAPSATSRSRASTVDQLATHTALAAALTLVAPLAVVGRTWQDRTRVLEVTSLLLEALTRKVAALQGELDTPPPSPGTPQGSLRAKENLRSQLIHTLEKLQQQWQQLQQEYTQQARGVLRCAHTRGKSNRSQPAIGLKQTQKSRVS
ncbi:uncharacterized protein LOC135105147 isoform X1 [Scylla paramamosain]|uniref:uncharacterized protein LOC135105147 isoform X1 n=1 Tax=Scylla paramamosain TaxID=85552 RepID=UPI0030833622